MYELALQRQRAMGVCYMYFVFRDGDCELEEVINFGHNTGNPYRTFEKYLTMVRPAVGVARYDSFQEFDATKEFQLAYNFDQLFVAVHHDATQLLLPYSTQWDNESWSHPSRIFTMLSAVHYHRHRIQFNALRAVDFKSGTYPAYGGFINPLSWLLPALQTKEQVWSLRYLREDWGHPRPGQPVVDKGEYRHAINAFDKCHPYFLPKSSGDLKGCPFFDPQAKTNFIIMQLIEGLMEDNAALRATHVAQQQVQKQQQEIIKELSARMKAMCLPHHDITFSPHLLTFCLPICSNSATSCHVCISVSLSLFFVQGALASSCGGDNTGLQSSNHHKRSQRRTRGRVTLFARQGLSKTNLFTMEQCVHAAEYGDIQF